MAFIYGLTSSQISRKGSHSLAAATEDAARYYRFTGSLKIDKALKKGSTIPQKSELQALLRYDKTTSAVNINAAKAVY